jgi:hypothetical protein
MSLNKNQQQPDGIILTVSAGMVGDHGYRHWLRNFLRAMDDDGSTYWFRQGAAPKTDVLSVYLCIGGAIRYKVKFVMGTGAMTKKFDDGRQMFAKAWIVVTGPVEKPPKRVPLQGFRGFRYTHLLF